MRAATIAMRAFKDILVLARGVCMVGTVGQRAGPAAFSTARAVPTSYAPGPFIGFSQPRSARGRQDTQLGTIWNSLGRAMMLVIVPRS
jgi:hypothetical protein